MKSVRTFVMMSTAAVLLVALSTVRCDDATDDPAAMDIDADADTDSDGDSDGDAGTAQDAGTEEIGGFGDPCKDDDDCATDVCHEFGQLGWVCTYTCETSDTCPEGSQGKKCNNSGTCRP